MSSGYSANALPRDGRNDSGMMRVRIEGSNTGESAPVAQRTNAHDAITLARSMRRALTLRDEVVALAEYGDARDAPCGEDEDRGRLASNLMGRGPAVAMIYLRMWPYVMNDLDPARPDQTQSLVDLSFRVFVKGL